MSKYVDSVIAESSRYRGLGVFDTVFVGGGTPTILPSGEMTRLISGIRKNLKLEPVEFTIEGNPNSYTKSKIDEFKALGMTRASVGVQSFDNDILKKLGRVHTAEQAETCVSELVSCGLDVSCDMMLGLASQSLEIVTSDINKAIALGVKHVSCYGLIVEPNTQLFRQVESGQVVLPCDDLVADMYDAACETLSGNGLPRYEVSNFGKPCLHNLGYWQLKPYLGLGASAHSLIGDTRQFNTDDIDAYIGGELPKIEEVLKPTDVVTEKIILGLRTVYGVDLEAIKEEFGQSQYDKIIEVVNLDLQCYDINGGVLTMKEQFWYCQNQLLAKF